MSGKQSVFGALGSIDGSPRGDQPIRIPGFELHQVLGMGAMGVVYRGEQLHPRRTVAVKVMRMSVDAGSAERIRREAITAGRCEHPCVVQVHAAGVLEAAGLRVPWIAMQYVDRGESLDRWASRVDREPGQVLACFELLADAMQHAHLRGVIHRDLKPSNILVDAGGRPRVIDFGLATHDDGGASLTEPGMLVGTLRYMAPEVLRGGRADVRSDIFALAVCLHECLVGTWPFGPVPERAGAIPACVDRECQRYAALHGRQVSGDLRWILARALAHDPADRYQSMEALRRDLASFEQGRPVTARKPSVAYRLRCWIRRNPVITALLGLLATVVVASGVISARLAWDAATQLRRAEGFHRVWTSMMSRYPLGYWPPETRVRDWVDWVALQQESFASLGPPDRDGLMRCLLIARVSLELGDLARAQDYAGRAADIAERLYGPDDPDLLEARLGVLLAMGAARPDDPVVMANADDLFHRSERGRSWDKTSIDAFVMLHASDPVAWECLTRILRGAKPSLTLVGALALGHIARLGQRTPEQIHEAALAIDTVIHGYRSLDAPRMMAMLDRASATLEEAGYGAAAAVLARTSASIRSSNADWLDG
jgi:hypothetical protein